MVGVAGKSKGCATCRRRKVKCDLAQPGCGRCAKAGLTCEGYDRYAVFIRKGIGGWEKRRPLEETRPNKRSRASTSPSKMTEHIYLSNDTETLTLCRTNQPVRPLLTQAIPLELKSVAIETAPFLDYFLRDFVCPSDPATSKQDYIDPEPWIEGLKYVKGSGTLLHTALVAISMVYCGKMRRDIDLLLQGRSWYSRALCQLCDLLSDDEASRGDEVLKGTSVCMAYETIDPSDPTSSIGWIRHFVGTKKLLYHRGPMSFGDAQSREVLEDTRHMAMMASLNRRESGFLAEDTWMTTPWISSSKSVRQQVADCGLRLAKIFEIMDEKHQQLQRFSTADAAGVIDQCMALDESLQDLTREIAGIKSDELGSRTGEPSFSPLPLPYSSMFEYTSKLRLKITILDIRLRIHETIEYLTCLGNLKEHKSRRLPSKLEGKALARSVLSLVSYYLSLDICSISKGRHLFALERAKAQFDSEDDEYVQCDALIRLVDLDDWSGGNRGQAEMRSVTTPPTWDDLDSWCVMVTSPRHLVR